jgi:outer membrane receptor protein involved in Fe transport
MTLTNTQHFNNTYIGLRGNISSKVNFNLGVEMDKMKNLPLYVNDNSTYGNHLFTVVTDQVIMSRFYGQLSLNLSKIQLAVKGDYRNYTTYNEKKAWQLPAITAGFSGKYNFQNLIYVSADVYYLGGMFAREYDANNQVIATEIPGIVDANIGFEYKYNKRLNAFANVNNFLNKQYRRWNQYPNYGINFMAGINYSF